MQIYNDKKFLFIFVDGFGLGEKADTNPFARAEMPFLRSLVGKRLLKGVYAEGDEILVKSIDAVLGVKGVPQSATGQTALLTGINAQGVLGFHMAAFPGKKLQEIISEHSLLKTITDMGGRATFANAYTPKYFQMVKEKKRRHSVTTLSVLAAGLPFRMEKDLARGEAVYWDMTNSHLKGNYLQEVQIISPSEAGRRLARIGEHHNLTLFETFKSDIIGHRMDYRKAVVFLQEIDDCVRGAWEEKSEDLSIIISSDHGNMEDLSMKPHTQNPVPLIVLGRSAPDFREAESITDISRIIISLLEKKHQASIH